MCQSRDCEHCRQAAREAIAHEAFVRDEGIVKKSLPKKPKQIQWLKFRRDVQVGRAADQADPIDTSYLTIGKSGN